MLIDLPDDIVDKIERNRESFISILRSMGVPRPDCTYVADLRMDTYKGVSIQKMRQMLNYGFGSCVTDYEHLSPMREISPDLSGWVPLESLMDKPFDKKEFLMAIPKKKHLGVRGVTISFDGYEFQIQDGGKKIKAIPHMYVYVGGLRL